MLILLFSYIIVNQTLIPQPQTTVENKNALQMKIMELFEGQTSTQVPQVPLLGNNNEDQRQPLINNRQLTFLLFYKIEIFIFNNITFYVFINFHFNYITC